MKNSMIKKLIASFLTVGILVSSFNVFAANDQEETVTAAAGNGTAATVDTVDTADDVETSSGSNIDDEIKISYSTDSENGKVSDNKASTEVTWEGAAGSNLYTVGTQQNPYAVSDAAHLLDMSRLINETTSGLKYFKLTSNIDLSGVSLGDIDNAAGYGLSNTIVSINPALEESEENTENLFFVLDGDNKSISNLNISDDSRISLAIFGYLNSRCTVKNIFFNNISITSTYSGAHSIGIFLKNEGTVSDCGFMNVSISSSSTNTDDAYAPSAGSSFRIYSGISAAIVDNAGTFTHEGFIEQNYQAYLNSTYNITVTSTGARTYVAGLIAQNRGYIHDTTTASNVKVDAAANSAYVGGFVAANKTSSSSTTTGIYKAGIELATKGVKGGDFTGAFCGYNEGRISYSTVNGNNNLKNIASIDSDRYDVFMYGGKTYGGMAAANTGVITRCASLDVGAYYSDSTAQGIYGGIAGTNTYNVSNSVSTGLVVASDTSIDIYAGGVVGVGSTGRSFYVGNCFTLVKLPNTTATLGSVVGIDGDTPYSNNRVSNCYYSSVVSMRPSPVSFGGTGASYGDLHYGISYLALQYGPANARTYDLSSFTYSNWPNATITVDDSGSVPFISDPSETAGYVQSLHVSNGQLTVTPGSSYNVVQTVYYDTVITFPENIGPVDSGSTLTLSGQPLSMKVMINQTSWSGSGTVDDPYLIGANQFTMLLKVPYGHFKLNTAIVLTNTIHTEPVTFWGTIDGNGQTVSNSGRYGATIPLFRGIYGSRSSSNPQLDSANHTSNPSSDSAANLRYGVVKNLTFDYQNNFTAGSSIFGNLCNGTVTDVTFTGSTSRYFTPTEENVGVVFKTVYGNSYIYDVYNDSINVTISSAANSGISGFIGAVNAQNAVIDNCGSKSVLTAQASNTDRCSVFIASITALSGVIQNCYSAGGVTYSSGTLGNNNYLFAARSVSSAHLYNCFYSPTNYYDSANGRGTIKSIPDGAYTGSLSLWSFSNSMYVIQQGDVGTLSTNAVVNINRFDNATYAANSLSLENTYFTADFKTGSGYTYRLNFETTIVTAMVSASSSASDSADFYLTNLDTGLTARASIASSSDLTIENDYYLIQKPMDLYMICQNQADSATDNGRYLKSTEKFKLVANIDMTGFTIDQWGWSSGYPFCGTLEGAVNSSDGTPVYTISGLSMSSPNGTGPCGLFGYVDGATITGIGISDSGFTGGTYTGALVGNIMSRATIANCKVSSSTVTGNARVGGLIGGVSNGAAASSATEISQCFVDSTVVRANTATDIASVCGGIIGGVGALGMESETKYAKITLCSVTNSDISANYYHVGGIVGLAANESNEIKGCTVSGSTVSSEYTNASLASVGGIAGGFGGEITKHETSGSSVTTTLTSVSGTTVTGENASGIVSRMVNFVNSKTVKYCEVNSSNIVGVSYAGGISAHFGAFSGLSPYADKEIANCRIDSSSTVKAKVSGGVVGVVMSSFDTKVLNINNTYSYAKVTTTGDKGSRIEGAGGFIGRLATGLDTSGITISDCISGGEIIGSASLGGIIGILNSEEHDNATHTLNPLVSNVYITATITQKSIRSIKGLIIGFVGNDNADNIETVVSNAIFSSFSSSVAPYGNITDDDHATYTDVNMGADKESGITVSAYSTAIKNNYVLSGDGTNCITLAQNMMGSMSTVGAACRFTPGNLPSLTGFSFSKAKIVSGSTPTLFWESSNLTKLAVGTNQNYNNLVVSSNNIRVSMATYNYKGRVNVYTYYDHTEGTETVRFTIGFTVICSGIHKFDGAGTADRPYKIYDAEDLVAIKEHHDTPNTGENGDSFYTASYVLMNDINLSDICVDNGRNLSFPSIGNSDNPFKGTLTSNGNNVYTISNLYISSSGISTDGYAGNTGDHDENGYSDCYGVFGYMEDAALSNIIFENATIVGGTSAGVVAGNAKNTEISNVTVKGEVSIQECGTGGALVGESKGALTADSITIDGTPETGNTTPTVSISALGSAGGIIGVSIQSAGSTISNFVVRYCDVTSTPIRGHCYAGAVAAQMNGVVTGTYDENGALTTAGLVENCNVSAVICGGAVGGGSDNNGNNDYGLTIQGVEVRSTNVTSRGDSNLTTAGGILGRTLESYVYIIKDCTVADTTECTAEYVVGGILGTDNVSSSLYQSGLTISNCKTYATLTQVVTNVSLDTGGNRKLCGVGGAIGLISQTAWFRGSDNTSTVKVYDCTLGGEYHGSMNIGGVIGQIATQSYYSERITEPLLSNCVLLNTIEKTVDENHNRFGIVVGAIEGNISSSTQNPYPDGEYACNPFINIFYSSYMMESSFELFGDSAFYSYNYDMSEYIYDLNNISFKFEDLSGEETQYYEFPIVMQEFDSNGNLKSFLNLNSDKFHFNSDITNTNNTGRLDGKLTGDVVSGFTVSGTTVNDFTVKSAAFNISSITSSDTSLFSVIVNQNSGNKSLYFESGRNGQAELIFTYENGLQIAIPVICGVSYNGEGDEDNPIIVDSAAIFAYIVPTLPNYYYKQTVDIDFSVGNYHVSRVIDNFTGHYDGMDDNGVVHKLSNIDLTITKESDGGIFGVVKDTLTSNGNTIPNIENLIIENAEITATGCSNVGILAGKLTNGASISNVTVTGSTLTTGTAPVGGIVGTIDGASTVENCTVSGTTLSASSGCVGGIAGVMNSGSGTIDSCLVSGSTISSGTTNSLDIAGGIVAQAVGTVNGRTQIVNEGQQDEQTVLLDSVLDCTISAYYTGGAVGANCYANTTSSLTINDVKITSSGDTTGGGTGITSVSATYSGAYEAPCAGGILAVATGQNDHPAAILIDNCYVGKNTAVSSQSRASGCLGTNTNDYISSLQIIDTQAYATVNATKKVNGKIIYAGGLIAVTSLNPNIITMNGSVGGGSVNAVGWHSYAGGAVGYFSNSSQTAVNDLFVNGVLSAIVSAGYGDDSSQNPVNCYGKFLGGMENSTMFVDNSDFSTVVFHDNYYSSYPQNISFFGMNAVDSFNSITAQVTPFEDINVGQNFQISDSQDGTYNSIAIASDLNEWKRFYVKFAEGKSSFNYGEKVGGVGKNTSYVDVDGFSVEGTDSNNNVIFELEDSVSAIEDPATLTTYYTFRIIPRQYGAGRVGAAYDCGLATSLPILCVEMNGSGTEADPFQIGNAIQLFVVGYLTDSNTYFEQINDIDLTNTYNQSSVNNEEIINYNEGKGFNPIGSSEPFKGSYDGQGYKIKGLYINRNNQDNVGLFGTVLSSDVDHPAVLKNIHIELLESDKINTLTNGIIGRTNVGGLVGNIYGTSRPAQIINCSVARSTVIGSNYVGGLCGQVGAKVSITGSFTESDVYSVSNESYSGGLIGNIYAGASADTTISKCFSSSGVFAATANANDKIGKSGGFVGAITAGTSYLSNCLFTGSTNSGHGVYAFKSSTGNTTINVSSVIDAGRNTALSNGKLAPISIPCIDSQTDTNLSNVYYDSSYIKVSDMSVVTSMTNVTALSTSELLDSSNLTGFSATDWTFADNHYPVPTVDTSDSYSVAYASLLSLAMMTSESEENDTPGDSLYGRGLVYPVQLPQYSSSVKVSYASSIFDTTDIVNYPAGYDPDLYGVVTVENGTTTNNKNTDLLFEDIVDSTSSNYGMTSVYRNIFRQDTSSSAIDPLNNGVCFSNGEIMYNLQMPVIYASVTDNSATYYREIRLPLSYESTYCISTQRQLFALGLASYETAEAGSKFSNFYGSSYNYKLITDINISSGNTTVFTPIGSSDSSGYTGNFNGDNHTISNLTIAASGNNPSGMFSKLGSGASVHDLTLSNATVTGGNYVGTLVGEIISSNVTVSNCGATGANGTVTATGSYVGGLIGSVDYAGTTISSSFSDVTVSAAGISVGGLIGESFGRVTSCYATGDVSTAKMTANGGIGGFIGYIRRGKVDNCFASGTVTVNDFSNVILEDRTYGVGGFVGIAEKSGSDVDQGITSCFSSGNVVFGSTTMTGNITPGAGATATVGIGGFSGINSTSITSCYSSDTVSTRFNSVYNQNDASTIILGIGGVCGVVLDIVQDVYSSAAVDTPSITTFTDYTNDIGTIYYGVGGAVGTRKQVTTVSVSNAYFDLIKNSNPDMTAIGDEDDTANRRSYTTTQLTNGSNPGFVGNVWGFTQGAYPYLIDLLNEDVYDAVKVSSILSVIVVLPDPDDYSAKSGRGITMAITVPTEFVYYDRNSTDSTTYRLTWTGTNLQGNLATPVRTRNTSEHIVLTATVYGLEEYGSKEERITCADMRGTYDQPYLIGSVRDWEHINMTQAEQQAAVADYPNLYGQWATPLNNQNQQVAGTVYYQLMSDIDVSESTRVFGNNTGVSYTYDVKYYDENSVEQTEQRTFNYQGFVINGNSYAILNASNASSGGAYFSTLDGSSVLSNIAFKDVALSAGANTALVGVNNGSIYDVVVSGTAAAGTGYTAGVAAVNNNIIDGCVSDMTITGASSNVGGLVGQNASGATITNSGSAGTVNVTSSTPSTIGALVATNAGTVSNSFSMVDMTLAGGGNASSVGAFIGANTAGLVQGCYTRGSISLTSNTGSSSTVALLAGTHTGGTIRDCYAAGNLGTFADSQYSILFASLGASAQSEAVYVDKAMAGETSYNSFKNAIITSSLISLSDVDSSMSSYFTVDSAYEHYPQISSILSATNTPRVDSNDMIISYDDGTVIRNYDVVKAYAKVANVTIRTVNNLYIDALPSQSSYVLPSSTCAYINRGDESLNISVSPSGVVNIINGTISTGNETEAGEALITATSSVSLRNATFTPRLHVKVVTYRSTGENARNNINRNFGAGTGSSTNPYCINSADSLRSLSYYGQNAELYFIITSNIDCSGSSFEQIPVFRGKLVGIRSTQTNADRKVIYNLDLAGESLIADVTSGAQLKNFGIVGANINTQNDNAAILASRVSGATIENVIVIGDVTGGDNSGLLVGSASSGTVMRGIITSGYINGGSVVGGVAGSMDSSQLEDVLSTAFVDGTSDVGGIAGEIVNGSVVDDVIFGGSSTGCAIAATADNSTMTDYYADYQMNISETTVGENNETNIMKSSQRLSTVFSDTITDFTAFSGRYIIPSDFEYTVTSNNAINTNALVFFAVDLASRLVSIRSGAATGTIGKYLTITFPDAISTQGHTSTSTISLPISAQEVQYKNNSSSSYLNITDDTTNGQIRINVGQYDENVRSTAVKLYLYNDGSDSLRYLYRSQSPRIFRYITPGMVKTVNVSYTLTDTTNDLAGESVGILLRSLSDASGAKVETINVFDKVGTAAENIDAMFVATNSSNGFYVADMLPDGYEYSITATDGVGTSLNVSSSATQEGWFVSLDDAEDNDIRLTISIVESSAAVPWGVNDKHSILWQEN